MKTSSFQSLPTFKSEASTISDPTPAHPGHEVLGDFSLPVAATGTFMTKPKHRNYSRLDAGAQGLTVLALKQCQDIAALQELLINDLVDGVSYLDAFDLQAMGERSHVYLDIAHKKAQLLNTHLKLFEAETTKLRLGTEMLESLDCAALIRASDADGCLKNFGLGDAQYELLHPLLAASEDALPTADLTLVDVYSRYALRYAEYEKELSQIIEDFLKAKQQAGRLAFYVAFLQMLSGRARQVAQGIEQDQLSHPSPLMSAEQACDARLSISQKLRQLSKMPLVEVLEQF